MQELFFEVLRLSLTGSLIALVVMVVRLVFRGAPKWTLCLLWGLVALRLVCPFSVESTVSLVPDRVASGQVISNLADTPIGNGDPIRSENAGFQSTPDDWNEQIQFAGETFYYDAAPEQPSATVADTVFPVLSWVWLAGVAVMLGYSGISFVRLKKRMSEATLLRENVWQCEAVGSPFVLGFLRPQIYLPYRISDVDAENVVAHERAHIHRGDHWWKPLGFLLLSIHWFNPVLWLGYILLCRDIEAACDERVIRSMGKVEKQAYSTALLNCSVHRRTIAACPLAFGEVGVKERVKNVMRYKRPGFWVVVIAVVVCIAVAVCFLTDPKQEAEATAAFEGTVLEIRDGCFLVEPVEGSRERSSADKIEVPMQNMDAALEPEVGDILRVEYSGEILESYPARIPEVYRISVAEEAASDSFVMVPTSANLTGIFDSYLYLPIGGETYRYQRQDTMPGGIHAGAVLDTVYEDTGLGDSYRYTVFTVENCTDNSMVLVYSEDMDRTWLYQYSPSKAVDENALQNAKNAGYVVMEDGDVTQGQEIWLDFYEKTRQGIPSSVKIAQYYTLDPDTCSAQYFEAYKEDYPCLFLQELTYDGETYTLRWSEYGTAYVRTYEYLMRYTEDNRAISYTGLSGLYVHYVLTHDDDVTWKALMNGLYSSQIGAYIDHYTVYTDRS